jgi:hypothetical protein
MKEICIIILISLLYINLLNGQNRNEVWTYKNFDRSEKILVEFHIPDSCPLKKSKDILNISFTGRFSNYTKADTWYPTWADDDNLYSPWTDGTIGDMEFIWSGAAANSKTGQAKITGNNPMNLIITNLGVHASTAMPYQGRYPCGTLVYNGIWYYGSYALDQSNGSIQKNFGWYNLGPFIGFRYSTDYGETWTETDHTPESPIFPEPKKNELDLKFGKNGPFIKMGAPHFVDFGKNMEHSPDGRAYLVGHGSNNPDENPRIANNSWNCGDAIFMARVKPSIDNMNNLSEYEFFVGYDKDTAAIWSSDFSKIKPIFEWNNNCGIVTMTYNSKLEKYLMCVTNGHKDSTSRGYYDTYLLESDNITGPWKIITYMKNFGPQAYFVNIPSKFISSNGEKMWLCYSANYMYSKKRNDPDFLKTTIPPGSAYSLSLHEIKLLLN